MVSGSTSSAKDFVHVPHDVIPKWEYTTIAEIAHVTTGERDTQNRVSDGLYPFFVRSQNVERINSFSYDGEAVLTAGDGVGVGKVFHYINGKFDFHQRVYKISDFEDYDGKFFFYYFSSHFYAEAMKYTAKNSVDSVRRAMITEMIVPKPSLKEQKRIGQSLSDIDTLISSLEKLIEKKRNIKQGAMQELLTGKKRLPGFKEEWQTKKLKDVAPLQRGFDLPTRDITPGQYPIVYSNGVLGTHARFQAKGPGVVTGRSGTIGKVTYVENDFWPHNTSLWVTSFKSSYPKFIYFLYSYIGFERFATGSGVPTLNRNDLHSLDILLPSYDEQMHIANVLSEMDEELSLLNLRKTKLKELKQAMMQVLLTGKIRLI